MEIVLYHNTVQYSTVQCIILHIPLHYITLHYITHSIALHYIALYCIALQGVAGPFRVLEIEGLDRNLCCGTHVQSLAHLRAIKLLKAEPVKGQTRVSFVAGDRVAAALGGCLARQARRAPYVLYVVWLCV